MLTDDDIQRILKEDHILCGSWRDVAYKYQHKIPYGSLANYAKGRKVRNNHHRIALGLEPLANAPACSTCGKVHISKKAYANCGKPRSAIPEPEFFNKIIIIKPDVSFYQAGQIYCEYSLRREDLKRQYEKNGHRLRETKTQIIIEEKSKPKKNIYPRRFE